MKTQKTESSEELLDSLLEDTADTEMDVNTLFENSEEADKFFNEFPMYLMNLWASNDRVIHILVKNGATEAVKNKIDSLEVVGLQPDLVPVFQALKDTIQYSEHPEEQGIRLVTLKQLVQPKELLSAHAWANDPQIGLYDVLNKRGLILQPSMEELRLLVLIDTLMEIRNSKPNIEVASRLPSGLNIR